ncbi:hypothetical protein V2I01_19470 [Micromonospora sp. BRA006-A]|nr:hypothetical protein [Micromonospora sp. BRA006-A]
MDDEPELRTRDWLPRTAALILGTLALASAFIAAYVGALHKPDPATCRSPWSRATSRPRP